MFMDDISLVEESLDRCLNNLVKFIKRYEDSNSLLRWEKCLLIVNDDIVLGHRMSWKRIEVDLAKVEVF